jgi:hypothetical protein
MLASPRFVAGCAHRNWIDVVEVAWLIIICLAVWAIWFREPSSRKRDIAPPAAPPWINMAPPSSAPRPGPEPVELPSRDRRPKRPVDKAPRAGLPFEYAYRLADGEVRARLHPIAKEVKIEYADYDGEITTRTVGARSVLVTSQRGYVYLFGYCHLREDERCFRVDRIVRIRTDDSQLSHRVAIDAFFTS